MCCRCSLNLRRPYWVSIRLCREPARTALNVCIIFAAYDIGVDERETATALVVRLGGLSSDISLLQVANGLYSLLDSTNLPHLGGNVLTEALCDYLAQEFRNKWKLDPRESRRTMVKLRQHAETCKHVLSTMPTAQVFIESLIDGIDWNQNVTRARFENVISAKLPLFIRPIEEFVKRHSSVTVDKVCTVTNLHMYAGAHTIISPQLHCRSFSPAAL